MGNRRRELRLGSVIEKGGSRGGGKIIRLMRDGMPSSVQHVTAPDCLRKAAKADQSITDNRNHQQRLCASAGVHRHRRDGNLPNNGRPQLCIRGSICVLRYTETVVSLTVHVRTWPQFICQARWVLGPYYHYNRLANHLQYALHVSLLSSCSPRCPRRLRRSGFFCLLGLRSPQFERQNLDSRPRHRWSGEPEGHHDHLQHWRGDPKTS